MAKFCLVIRPPCCAKEPPPVEASSCLDTDFTVTPQKASVVGGAFAPQGGLIAQQVSFCRPIRPLSNHKFRVVLNKQ